MKRSKRYRAYLVLIVSVGISVGSLLQSDRVAQAAAAKEQPTKAQSVPSTPVALIEIPQSKQADSETVLQVDRALTNGINFIRQGNITAAIAAFEEAVSLNPNSAGAHYNLGLALRQNNQLQAAATAFWQSTQADPQFVLAYVNLGAALLEGNNLEQAQSYLSRAIELDPEEGIAQYNMGLLQRRQGNVEAAFDSFKERSPTAPLLPNLITILDSSIRSSSSTLRRRVPLKMRSR